MLLPKTDLVRRKLPKKEDTDLHPAFLTIFSQWTFTESRVMYLC